MTKHAGRHVFTSESVSEGHPDKVADQISDAVLDACLAKDSRAHVACETMCGPGLVVNMGEIACKGFETINTQDIARRVVKDIGYDRPAEGFSWDTFNYVSALHGQSPDIGQGVNRKQAEKQGAGDQGMMFGYATNETTSLMPAPIVYSHELLVLFARLRKTGKLPFLRPDSKSQVTIEYSDEGIPLHIKTIVVSTQHDEFDSDDLRMQKRIKDDVVNILLPRVKAQIHSEKVLKLFDGIDIDNDILVNPTGKFVIGGPHGDTGLTGRKIIVDTYGGKGAHGGGAFSGKDSSKVDRSAAYMARYIAKNMVAAGVADEMLVQLSYAIGKADPVSVYVNTYGRKHVSMTDGEIAQRVQELFRLRPKEIERTLKLRQPMYLETAAYGHMGRKNEWVKKKFESHYHPTRIIDVELFTWEKLDRTDDIRKAFNL